MGARTEHFEKVAFAHCSSDLPDREGARASSGTGISNSTLRRSLFAPSDSDLRAAQPGWERNRSCFRAAATESR
jgi:hypothetical protein